MPQEKIIQLLETNIGTQCKYLTLTVKTPKTAKSSKKIKIKKC
jgi:hypothetical protein